MTFGRLGANRYIAPPMGNRSLDKRVPGYVAVADKITYFDNVSTIQK